jgi:2,4-didehydro-3-deoxy-L-rhamnonate hydrolase
MSELSFLSARPGKVIAVGLNYRDHAAESDSPLPESPILFAKWSSCLIPEGEPVVLPRGVEQADYEAELAVVIGRTARHVSADDALDFVAGYLALNDVTDREAQAKDGQWSRAKSYDTFGPCGPRLIPTAEIPDPQKLAITLDLNGERMQDSNTANMIFGVRALIEFISRTITLEVGDIISTGTPDGVGAFRPVPVFLKAGDEMTVTVEGIGSITNRVVREGD